LVKIIDVADSVPGQHSVPFVCCDDRLYGGDSIFQKRYFFQSWMLACLLFARLTPDGVIILRRRLVFRIESARYTGAGCRRYAI
ncbi:MAG: hypothetical protein P8L31_00035, partial [Pseudomonadales bacterium]|nr:hypothetical protein [Pseudomonadales bacterium]